MEGKAREVLVIRGLLDRAGQFAPKRCRSTQHVRAWPVVEESPIVVELLGSDETILHRELAQVKADQGCQPGDAHRFRVLAYIELRPDAAFVRLRRMEIVVWRREIPSPAELSMTGPGKRVVRTRPPTLRFRFSKPSDDAHLTLVYRWGPRQFRVVYLGPPEKQIALDLAEMPGGDDCFIAATYSNGLRSAHAVTAPFMLQRHGPSASIIQPSPGARLVAKTHVILQGACTDAERPGGPREVDLAWFVDDMEVGRGFLTSVDGLSPGTHVIALRYGAERGAQASVEVRAIESGTPVANNWPDIDPINGDLT
ncbi:hypothetical protein [Burkholderia sp. Ac-20365]|jgi:hypothetical protein|uniref:hypothetical protein n=1 Tax=Burkholderia sp. Ac-20365 TaxID=2703897 RepID=UPI00197CA655|nr:hypothetical protein [Burkholderia sp. Ac-20365]MBN3760728.1 hypothetical protein [Burkholderia sp. Ac-20365]